ncbi:16S rRNA (cytosine(1407)-C(5))-methyltransferase RsmF, partial [Vibrio cholerae]|nr:16S rRNA (cytosine(1407)-C(5))-methyltransferase RsmF [Vibrio cholerae]
MCCFSTFRRSFMSPPYLVIIAALIHLRNSLVHPNISLPEPFIASMAKILPDPTQLADFIVIPKPPLLAVVIV